MTTVADLIDEIRAELLGTVRTELNKLSGALAAGATTLTTVYDLRGVVDGAYLGLEDEVCYVWQRGTAEKTATIERGMLGTTDAAHADGTLIEVNPVFPRGIIKRLAREEIRSWPDDLFTVDSETLSASTTLRSQELDLTVSATDVVRVLEVRDRPQGSSSFETWREVRHIDVVRGINGADVLTINLLQQPRHGDIWVQYATLPDVTTFDDTTDLEATVGLSSGQVDIVRFGTAWRLLPRREIRRLMTLAQGEQRAAEEVPAGANAQASAYYKQLRDTRIAEEVARLRERYPVR